MNQIGIRHNTDKASRWSGRREPGAAPAKGHDYLVKYEHFLERFRGCPRLRLLELGAGPEWNCGASASMWDEYFSEADEICIAEIRPDAEQIATDRVRVSIGDLGQPDFLARLGSSSWDVIIDDASHQWHHQVQGLLALLPAVNPGGVYILEDIHTSFGTLRERYRGPQACDVQGFVGKDRPDPMRILSEVSYFLAGGGDQHPSLELSTTRTLSEAIADQIDSVTFVRHAAILVKSSPEGSYLDTLRDDLPSTQAGPI